MTAPAETTAGKLKLLLLDDDPDVLELYREMFKQLPSRPEIHTASSGARAMALLESEPFTLLISDLKMPKMDGLQVLAIVRRKFPHLRTMVMTSIADEQFRARAYSMGVDVYFEKPANAKEITFMLDCVESLLGQEEGGGFRGVQSKSLVDLVQLESLSQSSSLLKIINGAVEGRIWVDKGDIIDAATGELSGEEAFRRILSWKTGTFEILPPEGGRARKIFTSCQGLLLDSAQAMDEASAESPTSIFRKTNQSKLSKLSDIPGVEFGLKLRAKQGETLEQWGLENAEEVEAWSGDMLKQIQRLGDKMQFGAFVSLEARGPERDLHILPIAEEQVVIGLRRALTREQAQSILKRVTERWVS